MIRRLQFQLSRPEHFLGVVPIQAHVAEASFGVDENSSPHGQWLGALTTLPSEWLR
jgi:hypothetical protein